MPTSSRKGDSVKQERTAAAELALKALVLTSDYEILAEMLEGDSFPKPICKHFSGARDQILH